MVRMVASDARRLLNIEEAAAMLGVSESWMRKAVSAKSVPFTKIGKHVRFTAEHMARIITENENDPRAHSRAQSSRGSARTRL